MARQVYNDDAFLIILLMVQCFVILIWGLVILSAFFNIGKVLKTRPLKFLLHILFFSLLLFWTKGVYDLVQESATDSTFQPYEILGLEEGETSVSKIKKAYRKLQLEFHPDKNDSKEASLFYPKLVMAYETLSDSEKLENYKIYGHPDGSKMSKAVQLAMPSFLMNEEYKVYNLMGLFAIFVFGPLAFLAKKAFGEEKEDYGIDYQGLEEMFMKSQQIAAENQKLTDEVIIDLYFETKEMKQLKLKNIKDLMLQQAKNRLELAKLTDKEKKELQLAEENVEIINMAFFKFHKDNSTTVQVKIVNQRKTPDVIFRFSDTMLAIINFSQRFFKPENFTDFIDLQLRPNFQMFRFKRQYAPMMFQVQLKVKSKKKELADLPFFGVLVNEECGNLLKTIAFPQKLTDTLIDKKKEQIEVVAMPTEKGRSNFRFYFFSALGHCDKSEVFAIVLDETPELRNQQNQEQEAEE